ncbi:MAG: hypothetical protein CMJ11_07955 [Pelagibacterales bacterium]|nr:hypothetical protein [Pelagibacterales bacterium]
MKKSLILLPLLYIFAIVIFFILMSPAISKEVENDTKQLRSHNAEEDYSFIEDRVDGLWTLEDGMNKGEFLLSVNAKNTHADRLYFRLMHDCETINVLTSLLSMKNNPKIERIKQLYVSTHYLKEYMLVHVPVVNKLPSEESEYDNDAWIFWFDLGWYTVSTIKNWHNNINEITFSIQHDALFKANNYLDNTQNSWSTNGMIEAIDRAVGVCIKTNIRNQEVLNN